MRQALARAWADWKPLRNDWRSIVAGIIGAILFVLAGNRWKLPQGTVTSVLTSLVYALVGYGALWLSEFFGLLALAPYRNQQDRANALATENAELNSRISALTPKPRALPSLQRREDDLRRWIEKAIKGAHKHTCGSGRSCQPPTISRIMWNPWRTGRQGARAT